MRPTDSAVPIKSRSFNRVGSGALDSGRISKASAGRCCNQRHLKQHLKGRDHNQTAYTGCVGISRNPSGLRPQNGPGSSKQRGENRKARGTPACEFLARKALANASLEGRLGKRGGLIIGPEQSQDSGVSPQNLRHFPCPKIRPGPQREMLPENPRIHNFWPSAGGETSHEFPSKFQSSCPGTAGKWTSHRAVRRTREGANEAPHDAE